MAATRISGGEWRGRLVSTPRGLEVRPTRAMVREALFNILGQDLSGWLVVDLYAGAGTVGFEALSRGAARVTFVEQRPESHRVIAMTAARLGAAGRVELVAADAVGWLRRGPAQVGAADLCFLDAPYRDEAAMRALDLAAGLSPALLVCEHHRDRPMPHQLGVLRAVRSARYGLTGLTFYRRPEEEMETRGPKPTGGSRSGEPRAEA